MPVAPQGGGRLAPQRDHRVADHVRPAVERRGVREPDRRRLAGAARPADCRRPATSRRASARGWPPGGSRAPSPPAGRAPPTPAAGPPTPPPAAGGPASSRSTRLPTASRILFIASSNLYFSRKNRRSIARWNRPRATSESVRTTTTDRRRHHRPHRRRMRREQAVADQLAADQEHPRVDQARHQAEEEIDHAPVDDLLDLHQLVSRDAEGVRHREEERDAEHRPGRVVPAQGRRVVPGLDRAGRRSATTRSTAASRIHWTWFRSARDRACR